MPTIPLERAGSAIANAAGVATIYMPPVPNWCVWNLTRFSVACTGTLRPACKLYRGTISDQSLVDGTNNGANNTSDSKVRLTASEQLIIVFTGCTVGAVASVTLSGTQDVP